MSLLQFFSVLPLRIRSLFRKSRMEAELRDEMRFHLDQKAAGLRDRGASEQEALSAAQRDFGNLMLHQEECRDQRKWNWLEAARQDLRYSARALLRTPGFTALSICSLALGIGGTAAIFSVFDVAVLHPLAASNAARIVWFREYGKSHQESGGNPQRLVDWQRARSFEAVTGFYGEGAVLSGNGSRTRLDSLRYLGDFPQVLGARVSLGRFPAPDEVRNGAAVLVLTDAAWRRVFHADPQLLNRTIRIADKPYAVVGVLDREVRYPETTDFWAPAPREVAASTRQSGFLDQAALLEPGVSIAQAQAEVNTLASQLAHTYPATDRGRSLRLEALTEHLSDNARKPLLLFFAASLGVLLIACVNVAGLLLARGLNRQREARIRVALGAGRSRLVRLFLSESFLLSLAGCAGGILLASSGLQALKAVLPDETPRLADAAVSGRVLLFAVGLAIGAALLSGLLPAWKAAVLALAVGLKEGRSARSGIRSALVVAQIALSLVLLIAGGLLISSFVHLKQEPLGFEPQQAYSFTAMYPWDTPNSVVNTSVHQVLDRLSAAPGIQSAGLIDRLPLHGGSQSRPILVEGLALSPDTREREFGWRMASPSFFPAAQIPVVTGALFQPYREHGPQECLISEQLARTVFSGQNPVGRQIASLPRQGSSPSWIRIVGVVGDTRLAPSDTAPSAEVYVPWGADYWPVLNFVIRSNRPPADILRVIKSNIEPLLSGSIVEDLQTMEELTAATRTVPRTRAILAATLAGVALLLSAIGLFALLAHETARRTSEYGVRLALGANPSTIARHAISQALRLTLPGIAIGLVAAGILARSLATLLFEVRSLDPLTYGVASALILSVALIASLAPALRASRVQPITALRHE